ncbi:MAG: CotH kinase family protein, partial [Ruminococcus sp.]|nr:CotH kinase family protein [Ruminococcus sp.]
NDTATDLNVVEEPLFSVEGGFYDEAFSLALNDSNGNEIYYTTDGSDPTTSETAQLYSGEINIYNNSNDANKYSALMGISLYEMMNSYTPPETSEVDKGIVIRAASKTSDGRFSEVATNSYFIGKTADYYYDLKVISMSTDPDYLFDEDTGAYMIGSGWYEWRNSSEYVAYDYGDTQNPTNYNKDGKESEFPVNIQVFENGELAYTADVGARIAGNWTRALRQKSFRLYARSEYGDSKMRYSFFEEMTDINDQLIEEFDKVTLRNGGNDSEVLHFRDAIIQDLASDLAVDTMESEPCILFIDGEFWGFYMLREKTDGDYIESHYGIPKENVAVLKNGGIEEGVTEDASGFNAFCQWAASADMTDAANYEEFCNQMDVQSFMDYMTVETYVNNDDWIKENYVNNWQTWRAKVTDPSIPEADGKWRFIFYDMDISSGLWQGANQMPNYDSLNTVTESPCANFNFGAMLKNLMNNQTFAQQFYDNYIRIMETTFDPATVETKLMEYANAYGDAIKASDLRFSIDWAAYSFDTSVDQFRNYFNQRPAYAKAYLEKFVGKYNDTDDGNLLPEVYEWTHHATSGSGTFSYNSAEDSFTAVVSETSEKEHHIQSQAWNVLLEDGASYRLTFEASSSESAAVNFGFCRAAENGEYPVCWSENVQLTPELTSYTYTFTLDYDTYDDWYLYFNYGAAAGTYVIKNARLEKVNNLVPDVSEWYTQANSGAEASFSYDSANQTFEANVTALGEEEWSAQALAQNMHLESGKTYRLSFKAASEPDIDMTLGLLREESGEYFSGWSSNAALTADTDYYEYIFTLSGETADNWFLYFNFGCGIGEYYIKDVMLEEMPVTNLINADGAWALYNPTGSAELTEYYDYTVGVETVTLPDNTWEAQAIYSSVALEAGKSYTYTFTAEADVESKLACMVQQNFGEYSKFHWAEVTVGEDRQTYSFTFTPAEDCADASICFDCGYDVGTFYILDAMLVCNG